jgi:hypothetical protein
LPEKALLGGNTFGKTLREFLDLRVSRWLGPINSCLPRLRGESDDRSLTDGKLALNCYALVGGETRVDDV